MPAKDWYVIVKIAPDVDRHSAVLEQSDLEHYAQDVADSVHPSDQFESAYVAFHNGFGQLVRPTWAVDHEVNS